jgi:hypothetical protein
LGAPQTVVQGVGLDLVVEGVGCAAEAGTAQPSTESASSMITNTRRNIVDSNPLLRALP